VLESDEGGEGDLEQERAVDAADGDAVEKVHCQNYLTYCISESVLESQLPRKIVNSLFAITNQNTFFDADETDDGAQVDLTHCIC